MSKAWKCARCGKEAGEDVAEEEFTMTSPPGWRVTNVRGPDGLWVSQLHCKECFQELGRAPSKT